MGRNIFTSYIICNRLNLETFFEPIIDFIEIGENPPLRTVYETFISYSSSKNTQIQKEITVGYGLESYAIESLKLLNVRSLNGQKKKEIRQLFFVVIIPQYQVGSIFFI